MPTRMKPLQPIYIPSKGRFESRLTVKAFDRLGLPYRVIIEEQEFNDYASVIDPARLLVLDPAYQRAYDPCDEFGDTKSKGSGPARNFAWDHAQAEGHAWHWIVDDNIRGFFRLNRNLKVPVIDGTIFRCMEDFAQRYVNVGMAGPAYEFMTPHRLKVTPFRVNARLFSCILIRNDIPFRWRCRYNEDAELSVRVLKAGLCTVQFNAFLQQKMWTRTMKGGNTTEIYAKGTEAKSRMLIALHPDVVHAKWRFGRFHHFIDYEPFKRNKLVRREGVEVPKGTNEYGMKLHQAA